jgi:hypothetical protein
MGTMAEVQAKYIYTRVKQVSNHSGITTRWAQCRYNFGITVAVRNRIEFHVWLNLIG